MKEYDFSIATPADDDDILRLLRDNPVPGSITISYERHPSYFHGCGVMGDFHQTVLVRHRTSGELAGLGCRAIRRLFINGHATEVGYLGQLRADRRFQGRGLVTAGFRYFRELDRDQRTNGYITTIIEGNRVAEGVLVRRQSASLPLYREIDRLHTLALPARAYRLRPRDGWELRRASEADLAAIISFLNSHGAGKQFFPVLQAGDFLPGSPRTRDLLPGDFLLALQGGRIGAVMALWDQSAYKQAVVRGYSGMLQWGRPLYNGLARCRGDKPLPPPGAPLSLASAAFTCIVDNDPVPFDLLVRGVCTLAAQRGHGRVLIGLTERDPLLAVVRRYPHVPYISRLYTACWQERSRFHDDLDRRVSHVELATI
jgi:hypothetical protein